MSHDPTPLSPDSGTPPEALVPPAWFADRCAKIGVTLEEGDAERIGAYLGMLLDENTRVNLTGIREPEAAWEKHALDALGLLQVVHEAQPSGPRLAIADVGTGGGVPGIILALVLPDADVTLIDSTAKKTSFLERAIEALGLNNCTVLTQRVEKLAGYPVGRYRDRFDLVVARALAKVSVASELCVPLARVDGLVALIKGQRAGEELEEAKTALYELHTHHIGTIETSTGRIVVLEKTRKTPKKYPRPEGEPSRRPIGSP